MVNSMRWLGLLALLTLSLGGIDGLAAGRTLKGPETSRTTLPRDHPYQQKLCQFLATLTEKDFTHGVTEEITIKPPSKDSESLYRNFLMTLMQQPLVGSKRGAPAVNAPAALFVLSAIERAEGVHVP